MKVKVIEPFKNAKGFFEEGKILDISAPEAVSLIKTGVVISVEKEKKEPDPPPSDTSQPPADPDAKQGVPVPEVPKKAPQKKGAKK